MSNNLDEIFDKLEQDLPQDLYRQIDLMYQSWALFEATLTDWLIALLGVESDVGRIVVDRFDTRAKLDRIKDIYAQLDNMPMADIVKKLAKDFEKFIKIRNILAHKVRQGITPDKKFLYFWEGRHSPKKRDKMNMLCFDVDDIRKCTRFAINATASIREGLDKFGPHG